MNKELQVMKTLQRYRDALLRGESEISTAQKEISQLEQSLAKDEKNIITRTSALKSYKSSVSAQELKLKDVEDTITHITKKLHEAHNEKELKAGTSELDKAKGEQGILEEEILESMENISIEESSLADATSIFEKNRVDQTHRIDELHERIKRFTIISKDNSDEFTNGLIELSPPVRSRFSKLSQSKDGKALVKAEGGACTGCHNTIPPGNATKINAGDVMQCTNCGKFIYNG